MDAAIQSMRTHGFILAVVNGALRVSPADKLTGELRTYIRKHKTELIAALQTEYDAANTIPRRDLSTEQRQALLNRVRLGEPILIFSDTLEEIVYWVRDSDITDELKQQGATEPCYTLAEIKELAGQAPEFLRDIHLFKKRFDATLVTVTPAPAPVDAPRQPLQPCGSCGAGHFWLGADGWQCSACAPMPCDFQGDICTASGAMGC